MYKFVFRLKTIDVVIRNTKDTEETLKNYETCLRDVRKVPNEEKGVEDQRSQLKVSRMLFLFDLQSFGLFVEKIQLPVCSSK